MILLQPSTHQSLNFQGQRNLYVNPTEQVAFIRKGSYLNGASKGAPVVSQMQITSKTVLSIIDRKNNWVKVEVNNRDSCGEIGWVKNP